mmetsp:Transcript_59876/g.141651  ORF Transcript_59876/g.141651 Transcript_59876/m.141651 type:complete len:212 (+) Transcript_59876:164-799(+)
MTAASAALSTAAFSSAETTGAGGGAGGGAGACSVVGGRLGAVLDDGCAAWLPRAAVTAAWRALGTRFAVEGFGLRTSAGCFGGSGAGWSYSESLLLSSESDEELELESIGAALGLAAAGGGAAAAGLAAPACLAPRRALPPPVRFAPPRGLALATFSLTYCSSSRRVALSRRSMSTSTSWLPSRHSGIRRVMMSNTLPCLWSGRRLIMRES